MAYDTWTFVGLQQYIKMFTEDTLFPIPVWNTVKAVLIIVPWTVIISVTLALGINSVKEKAGKFFTFIYFLPSVVSMVAICMVWKLLYHPQFGILNELLKVFGLGKQKFLSSGSQALICLCVIQIWALVEYYAVILVAAIKGIDPELYEAAEVDGASIVRLDAFAYAPKSVGGKNFLNEPDTWEVLQKVQQLADKYQLTLLPEIHSSYGEKIYQVLADKGYMTYDFFLPGLIIDAIEHKNPETLTRWANEVIQKKIKTVNMLGCHDGIPLLDLEGIIANDQIEDLIKITVDRGGYVKNLHGAQNVYYQVNATYYSALGEDDEKMLFARVIQLFMPGKPQIWYLDLLAGKNDYEAFRRAGADGHKEINRTNVSLGKAKELLGQPIVLDQLKLIQFRNTCKAFDFDADIVVEVDDNTLTITWAY